MLCLTVFAARFPLPFVFIRVVNYEELPLDRSYIEEREYQESKEGKTYSDIIGGEKSNFE